MILPIITHPDPRLRIPSKSFSLDELHAPETQTFIDDLVETMKAKDGIGIAAPQTGVNKRIIVVQTEKGVGIFVNPKIVSASLRKVPFEQGCLSVPGVYGIVLQHKSVKIKAWDRHGEKVRFKATGLTSFIFQHEIDHLDGVLFIDKVERLTQRVAL